MDKGNIEASFSKLCTIHHVICYSPEIFDENIQYKHQQDELNLQVCKNGGNIISFYLFKTVLWEVYICHKYRIGIQQGKLLSPPQAPRLTKINYL